MDDDRRFKRLDRLLFQRRELTQPERWLGLALLGVLLLGAWLIFGPLLPTIINSVVIGLINLVTSFGSTPPTPEPVPTPGPVPTPSPSPSPSPPVVG